MSEPDPLREFAESRVAELDAILNEYDHDDDQYNYWKGRLDEAQHQFVMAVMRDMSRKRIEEETADE